MTSARRPPVARAVALSFLLACGDGVVSPASGGDTGGGGSASGSEACSAAGVLTTLADSVVAVDLAVDATYLYWIDPGSWQSSGYNDDGRVLKLPLGGGEPVVLASGEIHPLRIVVDATAVYWTTETTVRTVPLDGGMATTLAASGETGDAFALRDGYLYWASAATSAGAKLMKMPVAGGEPVELASDPHSFGFPTVAVDATHVYWTRRTGTVDGLDGAIMRVPIAGGAPLTIATGLREPVGLAVDATHVYWTDEGWDNPPDTTPSLLMKAPLGGGAATVLFTSPGSPAAGKQPISDIGVGAGGVYWMRDDSPDMGPSEGSLMTLPLAGGTPTALVSSISGLGGHLIVAGCSLYFGGNTLRGLTLK